MRRFRDIELQERTVHTSSDPVFGTVETVVTTVKHANNSTPYRVSASQQRKHRMQSKKASIDAKMVDSVLTEEQVEAIKAAKALQKRADRTQTVYAVNRHRRQKRSKRR